MLQTPVALLSLMAMATLSHSHFLTFLSLPSRKLFLLPQQHLHQNNLHCETQEHPPPKQFTTCALSNKKPRFQFLICLVFVCVCLFYGFSFVSDYGISNFFLCGCFRNGSSRKVKSNEEVCNDIQQFLSRVRVSRGSRAFHQGAFAAWKVRFFNSFSVFLLLSISLQFIKKRRASWVEQQQIEVLLLSSLSPRN